MTPVDDLAWLRQLYEAHAAHVRSAVVRLRGPGVDAEDLVQEVFLVAHRRWRGVVDQSTPRAWLYGVAVKVAAGARRRARLRRTFGLAREPVDHRTPAAAFERTEAASQLYRMLDRLPEKQRTVFVLFELEGCSGEEIAAVVGCPPKTVWTRLFHARKALARQAAAHQAREAGELTRWS